MKGHSKTVFFLLAVSAAAEPQFQNAWRQSDVFDASLVVSSTKSSKASSGKSGSSSPSTKSSKSSSDAAFYQDIATLEGELKAQVSNYSATKASKLFSTPTSDSSKSAKMPGDLEEATFMAKKDDNKDDKKKNKENNKKSSKPSNDKKKKSSKSEKSSPSSKSSKDDDDSTRSSKSSTSSSDKKKKKCEDKKSPSEKRDGLEYKFKFYKKDAQCTDKKKNTYEYGEFKKVKKASDCAKACVKDVRSSLLDEFQGYDYQCDKQLCRCLYNSGTLNSRNSSSFKKTSRSGKGDGEVKNSKKRSEYYCYKLDKVKFVGYDDDEEEAVVHSALTGLN